MAGMPDMPGMGMGEGETTGVRVDRREAERLGIRFARAAVRPVRRSVTAVGVVRYPEPSRVMVNTRVGGWVERLFADYVGRAVARGEPLLALYAPELVSAQEEFAIARRMGNDSLAEAVRRRWTLWNLDPALLDSLAARGAPAREVVLRAPRGGEIVRKHVVEGQAVRAGDDLFEIADRATVWVEVAVFEQDAPAVRVGSPVTLRVDALPGRRFAGRVAFVEPRLDERTRTLTARVEVPNAGLRLRPGMYATAQIMVGGRAAVAVPLTAVLPTGARDIVFVNRGDGRFVPREVEVGLRGDTLLEIVRGLEPGDEIVAAATFLLDSESNLGAAMAGIMLQMGMGLDMGGMRMAPPPAPEGRR
jgi:Cu(I)/Ag(I) efflux system membrane fusion protein